MMVIQLTELIDKWSKQLFDIKASPLYRGFSTLSGLDFQEILLDSKEKMVKFRLYDDFLYPPMKRIGGQHSVNMQKQEITAAQVLKNFKFNMNLINLKSWNMSLIFEIYAFSLMGFYMTPTHIVFCSYPNVKTIVRSYLEDPLDTIQKLQLCYRLSDNDIIGMCLNNYSDFKTNYSAFIER